MFKKQGSIILVLAALCVSLLAACAPAAAPTEAATAAPEEDKIAIAQAYLEALWAQDFDTAASYLSDNAITVDFFDTSFVETKPAIVEFWTGSKKPINGTIETSNFQLNEDGWVLYDYRITNEGGSLGRRGTSTSTSAGVIVIVDGQVAFDGDQATAFLWANQ